MDRKQSKYTGNNCCVVSCKRNYKNVRYCERKISFYSFPGRSWEQERRQNWITAVRRVNPDGSPWVPSKYSRICSEHFVGGKKSDDPRSPSFNPAVFPEEYRQTKDAKRHERLKAREEKENFVNEIAQDIITKIISENVNIVIDSIIDEVACEIFQNVNSVTVDVGHHSNLEENDDELDNASTSSVAETSSRTEEKQVNSTVTSLAVGPSYRTCIFSGFDSFANNIGALHDVTSISADAFSLLLGLLPNTSHRKHELRVEDKLLIFLMKLKLGISFRALGAILGIHHTNAARIFLIILDQLHDATGDWICWPTKLAVKKTMSKAFLENYPNCRVIIVCVEIRTEQPPSIEQQNFMYSHCKGGYTLKYLIGFAPTGLITYLSKGYGGHTSDSFIIIDCGLLNLLEPGDSIMVDKDFSGIKSLLSSQFPILLMPPFSQNNSEFLEEEMAESNSISSVRIHIETEIQMLKIFNILNNIVAVELIPHMDKILYIISTLISLQKLG